MPPRSADAQRLPAWTQSIVKIFVRCQNDPRPWTGTGTVVSANGLVISAGHVGSHCMGASGTSVRVGFVSDPYREPAETFAATFVQRVADSNLSPASAAVQAAQRRDLALLQIQATDPDATFPFARINRVNPLPGEELTIAGFSNFPFSGETPAIAGLTLFRSGLTSVAANATGEAYRLHYSGNTLQGASGGPVFNAAGELIGIHSARRDGGPADLLSTYSWATSVRAIPTGWIP